MPSCLKGPVCTTVFKTVRKDFQQGAIYIRDGRAILEIRISFLLAIGSYGLAQHDPVDSSLLANY